MRGHALPLPYLDFPSISFLIFVSPKAYLTLLKTPPAPSSPVTKSPLSKIDIPFSILRPFVSTQPRPLGITTATLVLGTSITQTLPPDTLGMHDLMTRPTFPLHPAGENFDYTFIEISEPIGSQDFGKTHRWFLDFTDSGKRPGVVMSQTRMREIESILNPLSSIDHMGTVPTMSLSLGSWVDLLVCICIYSYQ